MNINGYYVYSNHSRTRSNNENLDYAAKSLSSAQPSSKLWSWEQNQQFWPEFSVLTLRLKRSSTTAVSSKSTENHILACSLHLHLHAPLILVIPSKCFLSWIFFFTTRRASSGSAYARHVAWSLKFGAPAGTFRLKRKKTTKENIKRKIKAMASCKKFKEA